MPIDPAVPMDAAALLGCGVLTDTGAVINRARVGLGDSVVVIGIGEVGLNAVQAARLMGASSIVAVDTNVTKAPVVTRFGATAFVDGAGPVLARVHELVPGGVDHVIVCIGVAALVPLAVELLAAGGQAVIVGFPGGGAQGTFDMATLYQEKSILACRHGSANPALDIPMLAGLYLEGRLLLDELITGTLPLARVAEAFGALHDGHVDARTVLRVTD